MPPPPKAKPIPWCLTIEEPLKRELVEAPIAEVPGPTRKERVAARIKAYEKDPILFWVDLLNEAPDEFFEKWITVDQLMRAISDSKHLKKVFGDSQSGFYRLLNELERRGVVIWVRGKGGWRANQGKIRFVLKDMD